jgi:hypothetical protein
MTITESDWKKFKHCHTVALERFCANTLRRVQSLLNNETLSKPECHFQIYELMLKSNKELAQIFDGVSRSRSTMQLMLMRSNRLINDDEFSGFSAELQDRLKSF